MESYMVKKEEQKRKRKGMYYSLGIHSLLLIMIIFPFLSQSPDKKYENVILVEFEKNGSSKQGSSSAGQSGSPAPKQEVKTPEVVEESSPEPEEVKPEPTPVKTPQIESKPDVIRSQKSEIKLPTPTPIKSKPTTTVKSSPNPTPVKVSTPTKVATPKSTVKTPTSSSSTSNGNGSGGSGTGKGLGSGSADSNDKGLGNGANGSGKKGSGTASSGNGEGRAGDGLFGDIGKLGRQYYGSLSEVMKIADGNATIVYRLCIDRQGNVEKLAFEPGESKLERSKVAAMTKAFAKLKFEADPSAPALECGTYTVDLNIQDGLNWLKKD